MEDTWPLSYSIIFFVLKIASGTFQLPSVLLMCVCVWGGILPKKSTRLIGNRVHFEFVLWMDFSTSVSKQFYRIDPLMVQTFYGIFLYLQAKHCWLINIAASQRLSDVIKRYNHNLKYILNIYATFHANSTAHSFCILCIFRWSLASRKSFKISCKHFDLQSWIIAIDLIRTRYMFVSVSNGPSSRWWDRVPSLVNM